MRSFSRFPPTFWRSPIARALRGKPDCQTVAVYLQTCPSSTMTGLYYLLVSTIADELGFPVDHVREILRKLERVGFCAYDKEAEIVFVFDMAAYQVGDRPKSDDKRIKGLVGVLWEVAPHPFVRDFFEKYREAFGLPEEGPWNATPDRSPFGGPPEDLRRTFEAPSKGFNQEKEKEKEKEIEQEGEREKSGPRTESRTSEDRASDDAPSEPSSSGTGEPKHRSTAPTEGTEDGDPEARTTGAVPDEVPVASDPIPVPPPPSPYDEWRERRQREPSGPLSKEARADRLEKLREQGRRALTEEP